MNGVAREFWSEMLDLRAPADDPRGGRRLPSRRKKVRILLTRRPTRAAG
jgi:hypothetical protein